MKFMLVWAVATMSAQGPVATHVPETTRFETAEACQEFGVKMTPRLQDWVRGAVRADWDHEVRVTFRCGPIGQEA